jgi:hypothetical protein
MFPEFTPYANVLLTHPQFQMRAEWSLLNPYSVTKATAKEYYSNHKMAFDPSLVNLTVINGLISIYKVNTSTPMHKFYPCIPSIQSLEWVEQMPDDQMLRSSINASEVGLEPIYTSVWLQAQDANRKIEVLIMESNKDMLTWLDLEQGTIDKIRDASPAWMFGQNLQVFYTTLTGHKEDASWLTTLFSHISRRQFIPTMIS